MAFQYSVAARDAAIDAIETAIGTAPILEIRTGSPPANCAAADTGTLLASMTLPSDFLAAASSGSKTLLGTWSDSSANATGTAGHFRIKNSGGTTCHIQGSVTATAGGGDMTFDSVSFTSGQTVNVTNFTITAGGA